MFKTFREEVNTVRYLRALQAFNIVSFLFLGVSAFMVYGGFVGYHSIGYLTELYLTWSTPAPWAFSIMSVVLFLQMVFTIYQVLPSDDDKVPYLVKLNVFLPLAWWFEGAWMFAFAYNKIWLSFVLAGISTINLGIAYFRLTSIPLNLPHLAAARIDGRDKSSMSFYYLIFFAPTSLNFAFLSLGSVVQLLTLTKALGYSASPIISIIGSVIFTLVGFAMLWFRKDILFPLTVAWGLIATASRFSWFAEINITNWICGALLLVGTAIGFFLTMRKANLLEKDTIDTSFRTHHLPTTGIHHQTESTRLMSSN